MFTPATLSFRPVVQLGCQLPRSLLQRLCTPVGFARELGPGDVVSLAIAPFQHAPSSVIHTLAASVNLSLTIDVGS